MQERIPHQLNQTSWLESGATIDNAVTGHALARNPSAFSSASMIQRQVCLISCPAPWDHYCHLKAIPQKTQPCISHSCPTSPKEILALLYCFVTDHVVSVCMYRTMMDSAANASLFALKRVYLLVDRSPVRTCLSHGNGNNFPATLSQRRKLTFSRGFHYWISSGTKINHVVGKCGSGWLSGSSQIMFVCNGASVCPSWTLAEDGFPVWDRLRGLIGTIASWFGDSSFACQSL
ncbi:hypothetical protein BJY01DRAFT_43270 [Aspergillus pseudoustus]|uniref:Uncharacterized protein n=1 Tax=Aspergillus pseudoustus TaxID=1810923 RepID=A0ABR4KQZ2_9EURO